MEIAIFAKPARARNAMDICGEPSSPFKAAGAVTEPKMTRRVSLMVTLLLSLGLWAAIWALASAVRPLIPF